MPGSFVRVALWTWMIVLGAITNAQDFIACSPYGGKQAVDHLFAQEMAYPTAQLQSGIKGDVWLIFAVMADGSVRDLRIWRGVDDALDAEALRLAGMILWEPAMLNGLKVDAEHFLVVPFHPKRYRKWERTRQIPAWADTLPVAAGDHIHELHALSILPQPSIPGGLEGLARYCKDELKYPAEALRRNIQGVVSVEFILEPSGTLSNMRARRELGGGCVNEAFRIIRKIQWRPGSVDGERVRTRMQLDVHFKLP